MSFFKTVPTSTLNRIEMLNYIEKCLGDLLRVVRAFASHPSLDESSKAYMDGFLAATEACKNNIKQSPTVSTSSPR